MAPRLQKPLDASQALQKVRNCAKELKTQKSLKDPQSRKVDATYAVLLTEEDSTKRKKYKLFLQDLVSSDQGVGHILVMLCAISLGQAHVANMNKCSRSKLLSQLLYEAAEFDDPKLRDFASARKPLSDEQAEVQPHGNVNLAQVESNGRSKLRIILYKRFLTNLKKFNTCSQVPQQVTYPS